jgi:hypothetical protein
VAYATNANRRLSPFLNQVLAWADEYFERHGKWPRYASGAIPKSGGDTWCVVECALREGLPGLPGGLSMHQLLMLSKRKE